MAIANQTNNIIIHWWNKSQQKDTGNNIFQRITLKAKKKLDFF